MEPLLITALVLGLTSNFHCIGMCGPIALAIPLDRTSVLTKIWGVLQYNTGRVLAYSILGFIIGSIGITISTIGFLQVISIVSGVLMIIYAWNKQLSLLFKLPNFGGGFQRIINQAFGKTIKRKTVLQLSLLGFLNGLLPCGMVYLALVNALLLGSPEGGALGMIVFGIGTLPAMMIVGFAANSISGNLRRQFTKAVPYLLTIVGVLIVLRGMNLNIPMISPKIELKNQEITEKQGKKKLKQEVEMSCCHAPARDSIKTDTTLH